MSDSKLEQDVRDQLLGDASVDSSRIKITVDGDTVVLSGVVGTLHEKMRAREDASRLTGVREVRNELVVDKSNKRVDDGELKATAQAGLDANGLVPPGAITVVVSEGWVTLNGNLHHYYEKQAAGHVVRHLTGVQGFTDNLTVSKDPSVDVTKAISSALSRNAVVDAEKVTVADVDGSVTLTGKVKTIAEKEEAERAASAAPGVVAVKNDLVVTG